MTGACALGAPGGRAVGVGVSAGRRAAPALPAPAPQALGVLYHTGRDARCKDDTPESKRPSPQPRAALESYGEALRQSLGGKQPGAGRGRRPTGRAGRPPEGAPSGLRVPARFDSLAPQQRARSGKRPSTPRRGLVQEGRAGRYCKIREGAGRRSNLKARRLAGPAGPGRSARRRQRGWGWHQHRGKRAVLTARAAPQLRARADCWGQQRRPACHNSPRLQAARRRAAAAGDFTRWPGPCRCRGRNRAPAGGALQGRAQSQAPPAVPPLRASSRPHHHHPLRFLCCPFLLSPDAGGAGAEGAHCGGGDQHSGVPRGQP